MKKLTIVLAATAAVFAPAYAHNLEEHCNAYAQENGSDPSGCSCLAETADDAMAEELLTVAGPQDLETLSDASKAAIAACWPDSAA